MPHPDGVEAWRTALTGDPLPWLLEEETPAVRHLALRQLLDEPEDSRAVREARAAAMETDPIAAILAAQESDGHWLRPGRHYGPKYRGTVWSLTFLDQAGADPAHPAVRRAADHVLEHVPARSGGLSWWASDSPVHCLHGNTLAALIGFGYLEDERVQRAIDWQARAITGEGVERWISGATVGPGFACGINSGQPCAWGAIKAVRALSRVASEVRSPLVQRAIDEGVCFLLSHDPARADYPAGGRGDEPGKISIKWFKLGFPSGYMADVLQNLEVLAGLGHGRDARLARAVELVLSHQNHRGRWRNEHPHRGQTWSPFDEDTRESKWVTLRAATVLRAALG